MNNAVSQTLVEGIQSIKTHDDAYTLLDNIAGHFNFEYFTYARVFPKAMTRLDLVTLGNYSKEWLGRYVQNKYILVDPAARHCLASTIPYDWDNLAKEQNPAAKLFVNDCFDFGLKKGVSLGIRGHSGHFSLISLGGSTDTMRSKSDKDRVLATIHYALPYLHEKLGGLIAHTDQAISDHRQHQPLSTLSLRERECLLWTAEGKTAYEIAMILNIAEATVNFHLKNAVKALQCSNKTHAAAKAVLQGLLVQQDTLYDRWKNS